MTFTHMLSRRLALVRDAATIGALALVAGCEVLSLADSSTLDVAQLLVTPVGATLPTGGTQAFEAYARLSNGDSVGVTVTWSATGGTISSAGVYSAGLTTGEYAVTATAMGFTATAAVTLTSIQVASVSVSPASATLAPGATQQLSAVTKDLEGNTLSGRVVTWSSSDPTIATVSGGGLVTAIAAGSATITATSEGKSGTSAITVEESAPASHAGYYVAPTGSPSGDGSATRPWDLATALAHPPAVQPGDTIWLRGGNYPGLNEVTSKLTGTAAQPIIVRQYPSERAILDGQILVTGGYTWFWGFEILNSELSDPEIMGMNVQSGQGIKLINLIIHDAAGNGIGLWAPATDSELYGCLVYNNGRMGSAVGRHAHGIYFQNTTGTKRLIDNLVFNNYSYNFHGYTTNGWLNNLYLEGNVSFNAAAYTSYGGGEYLFLTEVNPIQNLTFTRNYAYRAGGNATTGFGRHSGPANINFVFTDNYLNSLVSFMEWNGGTFTGNTLANPASTAPFGMVGLRTPSALTNFTWNNNTYRWPASGGSPFIVNSTGYSTLPSWQAATGFDLNSSFSWPPAGQHIVVRPNRYEAKRAHVIVYNWSGAATASVDLSAVLQPGDHFEIREVQNYFATPVLSGTYAGGSVSLSTAPVTAPPPLGGIDFPALSTGTQFHVFVVLAK